MKQYLGIHDHQVDKVDHATQWEIIGIVVHIGSFCHPPRAIATGNDGGRGSNPSVTPSVNHALFK